MTDRGDTGARSRLVRQSARDHLINLRQQRLRSRRAADVPPGDPAPRRDGWQHAWPGEPETAEDTAAYLPAGYTGQDGPGTGTLPDSARAFAPAPEIDEADGATEPPDRARPERDAHGADPLAPGAEGSETLGAAGAGASGHAATPGGDRLAETVAAGVPSDAAAGMPPAAEGDTVLAPAMQHSAPRPAEEPACPQSTPTAADPGDDRSGPVVQEGDGSKDAATAAGSGRPGGALDDLPGIGPALVWLLNEAGIHDQASLAEADPRALAARLGLVGEVVDIGYWIDHVRNSVKA